MNKNGNIKFNATFNVTAGDVIEQQILNENGQPLLSIASDQFDKHIANQHAAYSEIEWELETAKKSFLKTKLFIEEDDVRSALFVDAIMAYGRVFNSAEGRNGVKLEGRPYWVGSEHTSVKRHNELMDFRNKLVAHTGNSPYRSCQSSVVTNIILKDKNPIPSNSLSRDISFGVAVFKMGLIGFSNEDIDETVSYVENIILKVQKKKTGLETKLTELAISLLLLPEDLGNNK